MVKSLNPHSFKLFIAMTLKMTHFYYNVFVYRQVGTKKIHRLHMA